MPAAVKSLQNYCSLVLITQSHQTNTQNHIRLCIRLSMYVCLCTSVSLDHLSVVFSYHLKATLHVQISIQRTKGNIWQWFLLVIAYMVRHCLLLSWLADSHLAGLSKECMLYITETVYGALKYPHTSLEPLQFVSLVANRHSCTKRSNWTNSNMAY